jgi:peptidoglycan/LPS O-acetylase OafA/YrhL
MTTLTLPTAAVAPSGTLKDRSFYRPELDILRFSAFLLVFLCHINPGDASVEHFLGRGIIAHLIRGAFIGGAYGVDLFFCLSSYLITTLLMKEYQLTKTIDVKSFYLRRILRIWPLYFTFLLCIVPVIGMILPSQRLPLPFLAAFALLSGNWACAAWGFPFSAASILWSVSIEEQFYLTWPLVMKRWLHRLPGICCGLILLAFMARGILVLLGASRDSIFCNTLARLDPIAAGALIGYFLKGQTPTFSFRIRVPLILAGLLGIATCGAFGSGSGALALLTYPAATLASVLLIVGTLGIDLSSLPGLSRRLLVYLGRISYGLYIFHCISLAITRTLLPLHHPSLAQTMILVMVTFLLTVVLASLSYRFLEAPFLKLKNRFAYVTSNPGLDLSPGLVVGPHLDPRP